MYLDNKVKVPNHLVYQCVRKLLVPSVNYAAFLDLPESKHVYEEIDTEIATFCQTLISSLPNTQGMIDFLTKPQHAGGLQLLLPGAHFDIMNKVVQAETPE
jgi:hypothetical protein